MFRPRPARWFEVLCARADSARAAGILARTGAVEIEVRQAHQGELRLRELGDGLTRYRALHGQYAPYWQRIGLTYSATGAAPRRILADALQQIALWRHDADPLIDQLQTLEDERYRLTLCRRVMGALGDSTLDFTLLNQAGPWLDYLAALLPAQARLELAEDVLWVQTPLNSETYLLVLGERRRIAELTQQVKAVGGRLLRPPAWLTDKPAAARIRILARITELDARITHLYSALDRLGADYELPRAIGDISCLDWFTTQVGVLELAGEHLVLVTGWTSDPDGARLLAALASDQRPALIRFPDPPDDTPVPQLFDNPPWARPFELFAKALGVPGAGEADPSPLLALVVPLLFGYMFGDVGQGLVLLAAGWLLRERFGVARLIMAGGTSAVLFGLLFGSVFSMEGVIPALWLSPLSQPLAVLAAPLVFAVMLLALGLLLNGLQAAWQGQGRQWLSADAGFLLLYLGTALTLIHQTLHWLALGGLLWFLLGHAAVGGALAAVRAAGELLERGLQLLVNTLSFARVGAFALAHAGLSSALTSLADAAGSPWGATAVWVAGNLLIILLEGLVVSIQTTRLVLFEFFNRFLHGTGRIFRPLPAPPGGPGPGRRFQP